MAFEQIRQRVPKIASANAAAVTATVSNGAITYTGGIPQFAAVMPDTGTGLINDVILATTGALISGINYSAEPTGPGNSVDCVIAGVCKALASAPITVGQQVYVANTSGQLGPVPAAGATNVQAVGVAVTPATEAGDVFSVQLMIGSTTTVNA